MPDGEHERLDPQAGRVLHKRLLAGDSVASAEIAERFLPWLSRRMHELYPGILDAHLLNTACVDALLNYLRNPKPYREEQLPLHKYLLMAAKGDLLNALKQAGREAERREVTAKNLVELGLCISEQRMDTSQMERLVSKFLPDSMDRQVFSLMADGIHDTEAHAAVLGVSELPLDSRRYAVKAARDRILVRLRRAVKDGRLRWDIDPETYLSND